MSHLIEWQQEDYIQAAIAKLAKQTPLPDNFMIYQAGWIGDMDSDARVMKLEGCEFRVALSGPNKGQLCVPIPNTGRTAWLSVEEIRALKVPG
jgi:hypothetical protein